MIKHMKKIFISLSVIIILLSGSSAFAGYGKYSDYVYGSGAQRGLPILGAQITVYSAGTTSIATIYSDVAGLYVRNQSTDPIFTDAQGYYEFYAPNGSYDLYIRIPGFTPKTISGIEIQYNSVPNQALTVYIGQYASIEDFVSQTSTSTKTLIIDAPTTLTTGTTLPDNVTVQFRYPGKITIASGQTLTISRMEDAAAYTIFSCSTTTCVTFASGAVKEVYPEWWYSGSGSYSTAISSALQSHNTVAFTGKGKTYTCSSTISIPDKEVTIKGYGKPVLTTSSLNNIFSISNHKLFTIKGVYFSGNGTAISASITPTDSTNYDYIIDDCAFSMDMGTYSISLVGAREGTIKNCRFSGAGNGVYLQASVSPFIDNCVFAGPSTGAGDSSRAVFYDGDGTGYSAGLIIDKSIIMGYGTGVEIDYSDWFSITNSTVDYNVNSIVLKSQDSGEILSSWIGGGVYASNPAILLTKGSKGYAPDYTQNILIADSFIHGAWSSDNTFDTIKITTAIQRVKIIGNLINFWTRYGIAYDNTSYLNISHNTFEPRVGNGVASLYNAGSGGDSTFLVDGNYFNPSYPPSNTSFIFYRDNIGYLSRYGSELITDGTNTTYTVTHYLGMTPTVITLTPSANHPVWADNITATTFDVHTDAAYSAFAIFWVAEKPQI